MNASRGRAGLILFCLCLCAAAWGIGGVEAVSLWDDRTNWTADERPGRVGDIRIGKLILSVPPKEKQPLLGCTEHRSRFLLLARAQDKTAASFNAGLIPCLRAVPSKLRQTLTLDNGSEMAGFRTSTQIGRASCRERV